MNIISKDRIFTFYTFNTVYYKKLTNRTTGKKYSYISILHQYTAPIRRLFYKIKRNDCFDSIFRHLDMNRMSTSTCNMTPLFENHYIFKRLHWRLKGKNSKLLNAKIWKDHFIAKQISNLLRNKIYHIFYFLYF